MADLYPKIPKASWFTLRSRVASSPTTKLNPATVAALLDMANPKSAQNNIVLPLRRVGLIDDNGALTPRGQKWRVDASYKDACSEIVKEVYPEELSALTDTDGQPDVAKVLTWFQHRGFGDSNARQMANTYVLIASADLSAADKGADQPKQAKQTKQPRKATVTARTPKKPDEKPENGTGGKADGDEEMRKGGPLPGLHIDLQVHIPVDATPDQIDQIFASMAKHLYQK